MIWHTAGWCEFAVWSARSGDVSPGHVASHSAPLAAAGNPPAPANVGVVSRQITDATDSIQLRFDAPAADVADEYSFKFTYFRIWGDADADYTEVTGTLARSGVVVEPVLST